MKFLKRLSCRHDWEWVAAATGLDRAERPARERDWRCRRCRKRRTVKVR